MTKALEAALTELGNVKDTFNEDDIERLFQNVYLELANLVKRILELRGTIDTQEFLGLEVPINSKDQTRYLETLAAWERETSELSGEIEKLEAELNDVVYEVYGLSSADREVIEEFLQRF